MAQSPGWAIIAGAGPGIGASVARRFAQNYKVVLITRKESTFNPTVDEINKRFESERAIGIAADVSKTEDVKMVFEKLTSRSDWTHLAVAVLNGAGGFIVKPFLEISEAEFQAGAGANGTAAFLFSKAALPLLISAKDIPTEHPPTLLFTGATASLRGSAKFCVLAGGKFVTRAVSQSIAREFGPQGIHVSHIIVDGPVQEKERSERFGRPMSEMISPEAVADSYWYLHTQPTTCFTYEIDTRAFVEKW